ncbi:hypothetical protein EXVG_00120 [Emiliania huxleyi virus 202]|nr:hypothetical protein EXVG_00120 [Emiliania huxleyi virus 202]AHA54420.1 hypothetical protein EhV18_00374 [Emiliania huxleyi virus 18]AHA55460.1 hypothetical protein EhV156_00365 [Emiliania huxleyi virus 156]
MTLNTDEVDCNNAGGNCPKYDAVTADGIKDSKDAKKVVQSKNAKAQKKATRAADKKTNMTRIQYLAHMPKFWKWFSRQSPEVQAEVMGKAPASRADGIATPDAGSGAATRGANVAK